MLAERRVAVTIVENRRAIFQKRNRRPDLVEEVGKFGQDRALVQTKRYVLS